MDQIELCTILMGSGACQLHMDTKWCSQVAQKKLLRHVRSRSQSRAAHCLTAFSSQISG